ncbi:hypothetical protein [Shewanella donghaensis]|uniref:hypothetical protein n=1 Tax=Shewanella donghaensis TaxID=238836 RepID=UPI0011842435|nr:hypothetical protein [Shewanella donghaensis]
MTATHPLALPLINIYAKGGYTVKLHIGSQQTEVNLIVDSGSSSLVVGQVAYHPEDDTDLILLAYKAHFYWQFSSSLKCKAYFRMICMLLSVAIHIAPLLTGKVK